MSPHVSSSSDSEERSRILHLLAYHRTDFDDLVLQIKNPPKGTNFILNADHHSTLGVLGALPVELVTEILRLIDLHSLLMLRVVNQRAHVIVQSFAPYRLIMSHAPHIIDILVKTGVASHFTTGQLFDTFCSSSYAVCGDFGAFLWIPDCIRCCIPCVRQSHELMPLTVQNAKAAFGLTQRALFKIPIVHSLPGEYGFSRSPYQRRLRLLSQRRAREIAVEVHGGEEGLISYINTNTSKSKIAYEQRMVKANGVLPFDSNGDIKNEANQITRFMTTTCLPYYNSISQSTETGFACQGCQVALLRSLQQNLSDAQVRASTDRRERTYTEQQFLDHFATCVDAQSIWVEHRGHNSLISSQVFSRDTGAKTRVCTPTFTIIEPEQLIGNSFVILH